MENGIIPLRHGSLPGALRLPKRYEKFSKDEMSPGLSSASKRKSSIILEHEETEDERMRDMMQAIMWVKQELVSSSFPFKTFFKVILLSITLLMLMSVTIHVVLYKYD